MAKYNVSPEIMGVKVFDACDTCPRSYFCTVIGASGNLYLRTTVYFSIDVVFLVFTMLVIYSLESREREVVLPWGRAMRQSE